MTSDSLIRLHLVHLRRADMRPDTIRHRESNLRRIDGELTGGLLGATPIELWEWQDAIRARLSIASVRCYTSHIKAFFQWAEEAGQLERDPSRDLRTPRVPTGKAAPITEDRLRVAIECAPDTAANPLRTWLVLAAYCGLRAGEIARLTREAIGDEVLTVDGKGGKVRTVPLPAPVRSMLLAHVKGAGPIWRHRSGRPLIPHDVSMDASKHLHEVGAGCSLHKLRHRYATRLFALEKDAMLVKELLGHESLSTTQIYLGVAAQKGQRAAAKLAASLRPASQVPRPGTTDARGRRAA